jgi:hypothetical protein
MFQGKEAMMSRAGSSLLALFIVTTPLAAHADSYGPFQNLRQVDPTGRYYLVARKNGGEGDPGRGTPKRSGLKMCLSSGASPTSWPHVGPAIS